jgi:glycosyltransferase involved in cell wall biosynthesis
MTAPLVLAVPVFNCARYLAATLESLNAQGGAVRWWLQDGASTDETVAIARRYARPGDTVVSEPDGGQPDALNRAFAEMGGEIVGFLNGDDLLAPGAARRVVDFFAANPNVDLVYGSVQWIDAEGNPDGMHTGRISSLAEILDIYGVWWNERQWVQPEVFFRRSLWESAGGFDAKYDLTFDYEFWVRCFLAGARVAHLPEILCSFRRHAAQKSAAAERAAGEIRSIVRRHLPVAEIAAPSRWSIEAQLCYDLYQGGRSPRSGGHFFTEFLRHPHWLLSPWARERAAAAVNRRMKAEGRRQK